MIRDRAPTCQIGAGISFLVPFRTDGSHRAAAWDWLQQYLKRELPGAEIIMADTGATPFNAAACFNDAARQASGDVLVNLGADMVCSPAAVLQAAAVVRQDGQQWASPYTWLYKLPKDVTAALLALPPDAASLAQLGLQVMPAHHGVQLETAVYPAAAWKELGGMPECFSGWGGEDVAWACMLNTLWGPLVDVESRQCHLWHPVLGQDGIWREGRSPSGTAWPGQAGDNDALTERFKDAEGDPGRMRALMAEVA